MTARRITALMVALTLCGIAICYSASSPDKGLPPEVIHIHGVGATFPAPLFKKWLEEYHKRYPQVLVSYDPSAAAREPRSLSPARLISAPVTPP
jgi:phosphate transport system substrate-binding protein